MGRLGFKSNKKQSDEWDKNTFIANLSHDIRTPLNVIMNMSQLLAESDSLNDTEWDYANMIYSASKNMVDVLNNIFDYSNKSYSTAEMFFEIEETFRPQIHSNKLKFIVSSDPRIQEYLIGDKDRIKQIVLNLLDNAVKYTNVGQIELKVGYKPVDDRNIQLIFFVSVDVLEMINLNEINLMAARQLCDYVDGKISVSADNNTLTFTAFINQKIDPKCLTEERTISLSDNIDVGKFVASSFKVLCVDDDKINLRVIAEILKQYGIHADVAESGIEAVKMVGSNEYNLVFMDYVMPEFNGIETLAEIRKLKNCSKDELPIVAITADVMNKTREEFFNKGINDFLIKPYKKEELIQILLKYLPLDMREYID